MVDMLKEVAGPDTKKVMQVGLTTNSDSVLEDISKKVDAFNRSHNGIFVELEVMESPENEREQTGKWRLLFTFASRAAQRAFWFGNW